MLKIKNALALRKIFVDKELEVLLNDDSCQTQAELAELLGVVIT